MAEFALLRFLRRLTTPGAGPAAPPASPEPAAADDETRLQTYLRRIGLLDERPLSADSTILPAISRLWQSGQIELATRLGEALALALPTDIELQLLMAELLFRQHQQSAAERLLLRTLPTLATNSQSVAQHLRARWLLAEIAATSGQHVRACDELMQILAEDWNYPGARARLQTQRALASKLHPDGQAEAAPFFAASSLEAFSTQLGTAAISTPLDDQTTTNPRYKLRRELGYGGSGTVYLAEDVELGRQVALKLFHPHRFSAQTWAQPDARALHEARLLSSLGHPGVAFFYELDAQGRYLIMEWCEGGSLRARLKYATLPAPVAQRRAMELCETLCSLHQLGVVHGDIKPENLLFRGPQRSFREHPFDSAYGDLVLSDFGVGMAPGPKDSDGTKDAGTLGYLPKERLHGAPPSPAADLYAVGIVLREMLGEPPDALQTLISQLGDANPEARPSAAETLERLRQQA